MWQPEGWRRRQSRDGAGRRTGAEERDGGRGGAGAVCNLLLSRAGRRDARERLAGGPGQDFGRPDHLLHLLQRRLPGLRLTASWCQPAVSRHPAAEANAQEPPCGR
eukprot:scaffold638_cov382-Prasinococcus_capsulatus_cf.AAC.9